MSWLQRQRVRAYIQNSIWIFPVLGIVVALVAAAWLHRINSALGWTSHFHPDSVRNTLITLASCIFTLIVFAASALLLAVQLASAQLTPRIIALVFRDPMTKLALAVFVFTFTFTLAVVVRIDDSVPVLAAQPATYSCLLSLCLFLYLIDHVGSFLRPSVALRSLAMLGHAVVESSYPRRLDGTADVPPKRDDGIEGEPRRTIASDRDGVILRLNVRGLVSIAQQYGCVIEFVPQVGDFVASGEPLFHIFQGGEAIPERALLQSIALGAERTFAQDPAFAFRVIVDVASKALSPAINDPTTAVLAIDQLHNLLRKVGRRHLNEGHMRDAAGQLRLVYRVPQWEDFVQLAVIEIRQFGSDSIQVSRRLRAMLENLIHVLPEERTARLRQELKLLQRSTKRSFAEPEDRALADSSDSQGVGGTHEEETGPT